jgi:hypothetical protein
MAGSYTLRRIRAVNAALDELVAGAQSATISTPTGQRSYTALQMKDLEALRARYLREYNMENVRKRVAPDFS